MNLPDDLPEPEAARRSRWSLSLIWLVPIVAALVGLGLLVRSYLQSGPTIVVSFDSAEGLEARKTEVRYKNVVVGRVGAIELSEDHSHVDVQIELTHSASKLAVEDSRFWVERPRVGLGGISGIGTLLSGAYIGVDIGTSNTPRRRYAGLEKPPPVTHEQKGRRFVLRAADSGSLVIGSPLYYRRIPVGRVVASDLDPDGKGVTIQVFVDDPYDAFVKDNTRFWNSGGIDLTVDANGLRLNTQSLATVVAGGVAFQEQSAAPSPAAQQNTEFLLYANATSALAPPDGAPLPVRMRFRRSTRGLSLGAPIDFQGITLGTVTAIQLQYDKLKRDFYADVSANLFPQRLGPAYETLSHGDDQQERPPGDILRELIGRGLRAQLQSGNLLTGQQYIALDFVQNAKPAPPGADKDVVEIPTAPGNLQEIQAQIQSIVHKIEGVPFDEIGRNLRDTLKTGNSLLGHLDRELAPEARKALQDAQHALRSLDQNLAAPDAPLQRDAQRTLEQLSRAAASLRALADYLEQHPESLLRGKPVGGEPADDAGRQP
jgi:paraquat-inducible protein B